MTVSTHVLDAGRGRPVAGMAVRLERDGETVAEGRTGVDGRVTGWPSDAPGVYRLVFDTGGVAPFFPEVVLAFRVTDPDEHHHVPLLLSPFAYSTYRGS
ncbi:hydroxyisourate hydrolase [Saccharothrix australiensis]|uniref:5-hydroxyisourate hydrolase n=1 Tax=Saccharothrix australiensis TaxID=2072 RepID=A0A495W5I6_9PSEU|nr:hydroxyisourate hydrolase [Saccharothrix australiensis]RKT56055.1 5-hydroxyisourate hydrolase [Saccharothrix australiensis]